MTALMGASGAGKTMLLDTGSTQDSGTKKNKKKNKE